VLGMYTQLVGYYYVFETVASPVEILVGAHLKQQIDSLVKAEVVRGGSSHLLQVRVSCYSTLDEG